MNTDLKPYKTDIIQAIKANRNVYDTVERCFDCDLDYEELTNEEKRVYDRVVWLNSKCGGRGRFDRAEVCAWHTEKHSISLATFNRDLALVNRQKGKWREAESELRLSRLLETAWYAVELAEEAGDAETIAKVTKTAWEIEGMKTRGNGKDAATGVASEKTQQHFNILVMSERSEGILETILANTSIVKHSTPILEIIAYEEIASQPYPPSD